MGLIDNLFAGQVSQAQASLSLTSRRQALLTNNLANVNVAGFKRQDMDDSLPTDAAGNPSFASHLKDFQEAQKQRLSDQSSLRLDGNNVDMEQEVMGISETQMRFQALTNIANTEFGNLQQVIK